MRGNGLKFCQGDSGWIFGKTTSFESVVRNWNRLPREVITVHKRDQEKAFMNLKPVCKMCLAFYLFFFYIYI